MSLKIEPESMRSRTKNVKENEISCKDRGCDQLDKSCHKLRESLFSSSSFSNLNNWGISNQCLVILIVSNACLALENISKFGITINPLLWLKIYFGKLIEMRSILILSGLNIFSLFSLGLEILLCKGILNDAVYLKSVGLLLAIEIVVPLFAVHYIDSFAIAFTIVISYITVFLKLISYHMVNYWCRQNTSSDSKTLQESGADQSRQKDLKSEEKDKNLIQYPSNLNIKDIYYFLFAPTLCYELNFPLLPHIRKRFLLKKIIEMLSVTLLILSIIQQSIIPVVFEYQDSIQDMEYIKMFEMYVKLTIPFYTIWLLCFFFIFHLWLNFMGEILRFGDRHFYSDWWNAESMAVWWRKWNIPVHKWCLRHIYIPMLQSGFTKFQAVSAVFFLSAIFHEYFFSLPLKIFRIFMFASIFFGQMSFNAFASDQSTKYDNIILCSGNLLYQPFLLLYYYYGFYSEHSGSERN